METAPFYSDIIRDHPAGTAYWLTASDGVRLRIAVWDAVPGVPPKGTVLLFPGRTEYIEKYAHTAEDFAHLGFATLAVDWRGQGIADRLSSDPQVGHVGAFSDFQLDVDAVVKAAGVLSLPEPWYLLGHSMGGAIGLRALHRDLPVAAAAFTGPMWGIQLSSAERSTAWAVTWASRVLGLADKLSPRTRTEAYVTTEPFADNTLTTDPDMYAWMQDQLNLRPDLSLGGPSLNWLHEALSETLTLSRLPSPALPCLTFLGSNERIVDPQRIHDRMRDWPKGELELIEGGEHEILMESPVIRTRAVRQIADFFEANPTAPTPVSAGKLETA